MSVVRCVRLSLVSFTFTVLVAACTLNALPGSERMGTFELHALPTFRACALGDLDGGAFTFEASFSREPRTGEAWVTLKQYSRDAGWDGQTISSAAVATRAFGGECTSCPMALDETLRVDLLSQSQNLAAGDRCPDGDAPAVSADAGIRGPGPDIFGYDAVRACGVLITATRVTGLMPDGGECDPTCGQCSVQYRLTGERQ